MVGSSRPPEAVADPAAPYIPGSALRGQSSVGGQSSAAGQNSVSGQARRSGRPAARGAPGRPARFPGDLLDLRNWYLTLPSGDKGHPDTVEQPDLGTYSSSWFGLDDAGDGVVFTANAGGVTENSTYPRSELRG